MKVGDFVAVDKSSIFFVKNCDIIHAQKRNYARVNSITQKGKDYMYDITVEDTHCYMVNGILTHNSETSWIWTPSDEDKKAGIVRIDQIKSRNAEPFPFSLKFVWNRMRVESVDEDIDSSNGLPDVTDDDQVNLAADI